VQINLFCPEIPPNTGNISRLCVNLNLPLGIIGEPKFDLSEKSARRAGLDYWDHLQLLRYPSWEEFRKEKGRKILVTKRGETHYARFEYQWGDHLIFGRETSGLPEEIHQDSEVTARVFLPMMMPERSINLSNAVAVLAYEAMRQIQNWAGH
jgi:tRNA (cytidine/uridine-2'-O-)-methyltransferase